MLLQPLQSAAARSRLTENPISRKRDVFRYNLWSGISICEGGVMITFWLHQAPGRGRGHHGRQAAGLALGRRRGEAQAQGPDQVRQQVGQVPQGDYTFILVLNRHVSDVWQYMEWRVFHNEGFILVGGTRTFTHLSKQEFEYVLCFVYWHSSSSTIRFVY